MPTAALVLTKAGSAREGPQVNQAFLGTAAWGGHQRGGGGEGTRGQDLTGNLVFWAPALTPGYSSSFKGFTDSARLTRGLVLFVCGFASTEPILSSVQ